MFENVTQGYSGGDATLEIVIMLAVAFVLGFLLRHIFCKPGSEPVQQKTQATEPTPRQPPGQPEPRSGESVATPLMAEQAPPRDPDPEIEEEATSAEDSVPEAPAPEAPAEDSAAEDDLRKIDGIGPKIAGLLKDDGIKTFAALAKADPARLKAILDAAGPRFRMHDPHSWPEQAALLAEGRLEELKALQASLKGQA